jgi:hypothetical protein
MATVTNPDKSLMAALGPFKMEWVPLTAVTDLDTVTSRMVRPVAALYFPTQDASGNTTNSSCVVSGRTITIHDPDAGAASNGSLLIFGF